MYLFKLSQTQNEQHCAIDQLVVVARCVADARQIDPASGNPIEDWAEVAGYWCNAPEHVNVELLGTAAPHVAYGIVVISTLED